MIENYREPDVITYLVLQTSRFDMNFVTNIIVVLRVSSLKQNLSKNTLLLISSMCGSPPASTTRGRQIQNFDTVIKLMEEIFKSVIQEMVLRTQKPVRILKIKYPLVQMLNYLACDPDTVMYYGI